MRLILPIFLILIAGLLFFIFTKPLFGEIKQLKLEISTYNTALNNSGELIKARDSLLEVYNRGIKIEDKNKLDHLLPSSINSIELALEVGKIANLHGIPIHDISFDSIKIKDGGPETTSDTAVTGEVTENLSYNVFPVSFVVEGRYDTFLNFLKDLETNLRLIDVKSISFTLPTASPDQKNKVNPNVYSYSLKIDTYWLK